MATLEDKILGEKRDYYCSSSEDEGKEDDDCTVGGGESGTGPTQTHALATGSSSSNPPQQRWDGVSRNTGPKGVLEDWYLFQKHEEQMRLNKEHELIAMVERASMTCLPENGTTDVVQVLPEKDELESDNILQDFIKQRMEAMLQAQAQRKQFGGLEELPSADEYLKLVDDKESNVTIVLHIYENSISQCVKMNECLASISGDYRHVRFCKMKAGVAGMSNLFKLQGVPAILVYQGGELIGNFVRLREEFGDEFYAGDVENYLIENGILNSSKT